MNSFITTFLSKTKLHYQAFGALNILIIWKKIIHAFVSIYHMRVYIYCLFFRNKTNIFFLYIMQIMFSDKIVNSNFWSVKLMFIMNQKMSLFCDFVDKVIKEILLTWYYVGVPQFSSLLFYSQSHSTLMPTCQTSILTLVQLLQCIINA